MENEVWKPISGFETFYEISSLGNVRGLDRMVSSGRGNVRLAKGKAIERGLNPVTGYPHVSLWKDGKGCSYAIHRLVAETFHGPCPPNMQCAHLDGDRQNPRATNLCWVTRVENMSHCVEHGTLAYGERCGSSKVTEAQVKEIRRRFEMGEHRRLLAEEFGIKERQVFSIARRETWATL